jgi:hypothetical protein
VSEPLDVAQRAVGEVAHALKIDVDPLLVAQVAGLLLGLLTGSKWAAAEREGAEAAAAITTAAEAEAAARSRR